jgi:hypothetical protein
MATFNKLEGIGITVDIPHEWDDVTGSARHSTSPFKVANLVEGHNIFHEIKANLGLHFLTNPEPWLFIKLLHMYWVKDGKIMCNSCNNVTSRPVEFSSCNSKTPGNMFLN